ncbi:MAG: LysR substrate-binding domain-containing protein [Actinocatenispora sp.]
MGIDPTFQQLRVFLVVAEELHFGRAAARLHLAQPPVSRHVKALEAVVGASLFDRTARSVTLTPAGALLRREAEAMLSRWDSTTDRARDLAAAKSRTLRLGCVEAMAVDALPAAVARMRALRRDVVWELSEGNTSELLDGFAAARFDSVLVRGPIPVGAGVDSVVVHNDELVAALPAGHRLAAPEIPLDTLAGEDFIVYNRRARSGLLPAVLAACGQAGFAPRIRYEALGTQLVLGLVAAGDGVSLVSGVAARMPHRGVRFARLVGRPAISPIVLAWHPDVPTAVMAELAELLHIAAGDGQGG